MPTQTRLSPAHPGRAHPLEHTILGLHLGQLAPGFAALGNVSALPAGTSTASKVLMKVVLNGRVSCGDTWYGPGNHFFPEPEQEISCDEPALIWTLRDGPRFRSDPLWAGALADALQDARSGELCSTQRDDALLPDPDTLCDVDHPLVRRIAARLRRATPVSTATAVFDYVQKMPYRFGPWQERASETLERGIGMCTTKANAQVALCRALGLEAGFVEMPMGMDVLGLLMPPGWPEMMKSSIRHYYAAVKLDGRWHPHDATFNGDVFEMFCESNPDYEMFRPWKMVPGEPFAPTALWNGSDPFDIEVRPDLAYEMGKKSRFRPHQFEALNTRLDLAQHVVAGHLPDRTQEGPVRTYAAE